MRLRFVPTERDMTFEFSLFVYFAVLMLVYQVPTYLDVTIHQGGNLTLAAVLNDARWPLAFLAVHLFLLLILRKQLVFRAGAVFLSGVLLAFYRAAVVPGIIDPVNIFIMTGTCALILVIYQTRFLEERLDSISAPSESCNSALEQISDAYKLLLNRSVQAWLAVGAALSVSMSILFRQGWTEISLRFTAVKMLVGFMGISLAVVIWGIIPMLNGLVAVNDKTLSLASKTELSATDESSEITSPPE